MKCRFCGETGKCLPECITVTSPAVEIKPSAALADYGVDDCPQPVIDALEQWAAQYQRWNLSSGNYPSPA